MLNAAYTVSVLPLPLYLLKYKIDLYMEKLHMCLNALNYEL